MIDFHNHVIPNIDDGAKNMDVAFEMLAKAFYDGTKTVVNTVHFQHPSVKTFDKDKNFIFDQKKKLEDLIAKNNINVDLLLKAEVFYKPNLPRLIDNELLIVKEKYMLIEFNPIVIPDEHEEVLYKLQLEGIIPIIAHPERYRSIQNNIKNAQRWIDLGYFLQINAGSIIGKSGKSAKKTSLNLLKNGFCHLIGSDAHNNGNRNFYLKDALGVVESKFGVNNKEIIIRNSERLLIGEDLKTINSQKKDSFFDSIKKMFNK